MMRALVAGITALAVLTACGGDGGTGPVAVASVTVSPALDTVIPGQTLQLTASARDANGGAIEGRGITWTSSSSAIATVSSAGLVTGVGEGAVTVSASIGGIAGAAVVTVRFPFPNAAGTYTITGRFDNGAANIGGNFVLTQASRLAETLSGSFEITLFFADGTRRSTFGPIANATVDEEGIVAFSLGNPTTASYWIFAGLLTGNAITGGIHELGGSTGAFRGTWQGVRTGPLVSVSRGNAATKDELLRLLTR